MSGKKGGKQLKGFLVQLYDMINDPQNAGIIEWDGDSNRGVILDEHRLAQEVFPRYFSHRRITSFVRQLHNYGFHTTHGERGHTFENELFRRGRPDLLPELAASRSKAKRKSASSTGRKKKRDKASANTVPLAEHTRTKQELEALRDELAALRTTTERLTFENRQLWNIILSQEESQKMIQKAFHTINYHLNGFSRMPAAASQDDTGPLPFLSRKRKLDDRDPTNIPLLMPTMPASSSAIETLSSSDPIMDPNAYTSFPPAIPTATTISTTATTEPQASLAATQEMEMEIDPADILNLGDLSIAEPIVPGLLETSDPLSSEPISDLVARSDPVPIYSSVTASQPMATNNMASTSPFGTNTSFTSLTSHPSHSQGLFFPSSTATAFGASAAAPMSLSSPTVGVSTYPDPPASPGTMASLLDAQQRNRQRNRQQRYAEQTPWSSGDALGSLPTVSLPVPLQVDSDHGHHHHNVTNADGVDDVDDDDDDDIEHISRDSTSMPKVSTLEALSRVQPSTKLAATFLSSLTVADLSNIGNALKSLLRTMDQLTRDRATMIAAYQARAATFDNPTLAPGVPAIHYHEAVGRPDLAHSEPNMGTTDFLQ